MTNNPHRGRDKSGEEFEQMLVPRAAVETLLMAFAGPMYLINEIHVTQRLSAKEGREDIDPRVDPVTALKRAMRDHIVKGGDDG